MKFSGALWALPLLLGAMLSGAAPSPVADAAMKGDIASVRARFMTKPTSTLPKPTGATAMQWAAYRSDLALADVLIAAGANAKAANREGATPLYLAGLAGNGPMIAKLLQAGADANEIGPQGETPLMLAARSGDLNSLKVLLDYKAQINAKDKLRGTTAVMWAVEQSHPAAVKLLIEHGADVTINGAPDAGGKPRNNLANPKTQRQASVFGAGFGGGAAGAAKPAGPKKTAAEVSAELLLPE